MELLLAEIEIRGDKLILAALKEQPELKPRKMIIFWVIFLVVI